MRVCMEKFGSCMGENHGGGGVIERYWHCEPVVCFLSLFGLKSSFIHLSYYLIIAFRASSTSLAGIMNGEKIGSSKPKLDSNVKW